MLVGLLTMWLFHICAEVQNLRTLVFYRDLASTAMDMAGSVNSNLGPLLDPVGPSSAPSGSTLQVPLPNLICPSSPTPIPWVPPQTPARSPRTVKFEKIVPTGNTHTLGLPQGWGDDQVYTW